MMHMAGWMCYVLALIAFCIFAAIHWRNPGYILSFPRFWQESVEVWVSRTDRLYGAFLVALIINTLILFGALWMPMAAPFFIKLAISASGIVVSLLSLRVDRARQAYEAMLFEKTICILLLFGFVFTNI